MAPRKSDREVLNEIRDRDPELWAELEAELEGPTPESGVSLMGGAGPSLEGFGVGGPGMGLEAIIRAKGRPVLAIAHDSAVIQLGPADAKTWKTRLQKVQAVLTPAIRAIGRIEVGGHDRADWLGTGWLIAPDVVVTNRHVAVEFARASAGSATGFAFRASPSGGSMSASIDFIEEIGRSDSARTFPLSEVLHIEDDDGPDMALMRVTTSTGGTPIALHGSASKSKMVAVVGYPARDTRNLDQKLMDRLFGEVYETKRLAPGEVTGKKDGFVLHDCTTLGGNSGSPVLDLATGQAVALHFAGRYRETNYAVPADVVADVLGRVTRGESKRTYSIPAPANGGAVAAHAVSATTSVGGRMVRTTIPIHITVEIDAPMTGSASAPTQTASPPPPPPTGISAPAADGSLGEEAVSHGGKPSDYLDRKGYLDNFLPVKVPLPVVKGGKDVLAFDFNGVKKETVLRYEHFSVVMNSKLRMCFFSAVNINGKSSQKTKRSGWRTDPRIPETKQIAEECYGNPPRFSRGHMTRREDPAWGTPKEADRGNDDSMHVTNVTPQMQAFNGAVWLSLEDYALQNARKAGQKISVFTGPIFGKSDPVKFGVPIPRAFWKIIAFIHDDTGKLSATGYSISQNEHLEAPEFVFGKFKTFQRSLPWIEQRTGLTFGPLTKADRFKEPESGVEIELVDPTQIQW
ncbi:MAG: DNA/RNA non-specific endonuclease [Phycisphaerales bacterium]